MPGVFTLEIEISLVSNKGFWLLLDNEELFVAYEEFHWFKQSTVDQITTIERPSPNHLYWPMLDVDLAVESIRNPASFPLIAKHNSLYRTCYQFLEVSVSFSVWRLRFLAATKPLQKFPLQMASRRSHNRI